MSEPQQTILASCSVTELDKIEAALRRNREKLAAIYEMERHIHLEFDPSRMTEMILDAVLKAFPKATSVAIGTVDAGSHRVTVLSGRSTVPRKDAPISRSMARGAFQERHAVCFEDAQVDLAEAESVVSSGIKCAMAAPLWTGHEMCGVIQVSSTSEARCFSEEDLDLFTLFANRAATALANAELNEERQRTAHFQELTEYLANELRNAASPLVGWLESLHSGALGPLDDVQSEAVRSAKHGAEMVGLMVTSMTDLAQLKEPGLVIEKEPVSIDEAVGPPFRLSSEIAASKGLVLRSDIPPGLPPAMADRRLLQHVVFNILSFSLAWAEPSWPLTLSGGSERDTVVVSVECACDPILAQQGDALFDPATQARLWKSLGFRSVGIGLAFCKVAVERMDGRIWMHGSDPTSSLRVALPAATGRG